MTMPLMRRCMRMVMKIRRRSRVIDLVVLVMRKAVAWGERGVWNEVIIHTQSRAEKVAFYLLFWYKRGRMDMRMGMCMVCFGMAI